MIEPSGRQVLLFDFRTSGGQSTGPFTRLIGDHSGAILGTFHVSAVAVGPLPKVGATRGI